MFCRFTFQVSKEELILGNIEGDLFIFKGDGPSAWRKGSDLGMITCIRAGDFCNRGKNNLICLTAEGWCYIFDIKPDGIPEDDECDGDRSVKPAYTQHLPANGKVMLIADTDNDSQTEMVVGYSDRVVRIFRWVSAPEGEPYTSGRIIQLQQWQLAGQIGSITVNHSQDGQCELMASQPGGTFVTLLHDQGSHSDSDEPKQQCLIYHPLGSSRARNKDVSTIIIGGISRDKKDKSEPSSTYYALATLDGTLSLVESDKILWSLQVDHQLFSMHKMDVTGNGKEEVVCCSWDGQIYIVNHSKEVVRYHFEENVAGFTAGHYCLTSEGDVPCFIFATFHNRIFIYYNISLPQVESINLLQVINKREEMQHVLTKLNIDPQNKESLRRFYQWCLYGWQNKS
ncbi:KICSTOR complex protein ITFG2-like isoform X2 [Gigantopelta aegis]|uniref:KICSTOR complex protein ITFG2-like isoform X2 n=1 Tax=Gigantopelta aegis TaxID=1735272 RepID=UPI001B88B6CF|nr:KICSTOR complex protein ITFG2-like isoform X2 [Gigantopelta aegis]